MNNILELVFFPTEESKNCFYFQLWNFVLSFHYQDCKWKMYMEMDGDDIAVAYIKDVTFNTNLTDAEILKMTKVRSHL